MNTTLHQNHKPLSAKLLTTCLAFLLAPLFLAACAQQAAPVKQQYMFWPPAPDAPHVEFLTSISTTSDITAAQEKLDRLIYGQEQTIDLPFERPYGVRMFNGAIYVCDATSANVSILDLRQKQVRILGKGGQVTLLKPIDIAVSPDGVKYVADTGLGAVIVFGADDKYAGRISVKDLRPVSVALHGNELYVSDIYASRIRIFDRFDGKELRTIGGPGSESGKFGGAMGIALDSQANLYVNDVIGCRVQKFSPDGNVVSSFGHVGDAAGSFARPKHMTVDSDGILYVVDAAFGNVQMFNDKAQMLMFFGGNGNHPGAMDMPTGICTSDTDLDLFQKYVHPAFQLQRLIIVTNNLGKAKINIYGLGILKPGKTVDDINAARVQGTFGFDTRPNLDRGVPATLPAADTQPATQPSTQPAPSPATQPATLPAPPAVPGQKPF